MMNTEHFSIIRTGEPGKYSVYMNDKKQAVKDRFLLLSQKDAFGISLEELKFLPFQVGIKREIRDPETGKIEIDLGTHSITIVNINHESVTASFMIFGPRDENESIYLNTFDLAERTQQYYEKLYAIVKNDPRFTFTDEYQDYDKPDIELQVFAENNPDIECHQWGPFEFLAEIEAKTFGEFCLKAEQISYELDREATKIVLATC